MIMPSLEFSVSIVTSIADDTERSKSVDNFLAIIVYIAKRGNGRRIKTREMGRRKEQRFHFRRIVSEFPDLPSG